MQKLLKVVSNPLFLRSSHKTVTDMITTVTFPSWQQLITENLLHSDFFSGLCLISNQNQVVYAYGTLKDLNKADIEQLNVFARKKCKEDPTVLKLHLNAAAQTFHFRIYHRTHVSVYATSSGNLRGLTLSKLQHGTFITMFQKPTPTHRAITLVEDFTDKLRC